MTQSPWASGPSEILQHGLSLLEKDSDKNRRLAMISIDNAVELTIKTFLGLPKRITGINISRKEYQEISESFPMLLDALEKHVSSKLEGIDLGEIEWFHRLRNQLYHQGNGLTVEKDKVEIYAELAKILFQNLFGFDVEVNLSEGNSHELLGDFLATWVEIERNLFSIGADYAKEMDSLRKGEVTGQFRGRSIVAHYLSELGFISKNTSDSIDYLGRIRNTAVHGTEDYRRIITPKIVEQAHLVLVQLKNSKAKYNKENKL